MSLPTMEHPAFVYAERYLNAGTAEGLAFQLPNGLLTIRWGFVAAMALIGLLYICRYFGCGFTRGFYRCFCRSRSKLKVPGMLKVGSLLTPNGLFVVHDGVLHCRPSEGCHPIPLSLSEVIVNSDGTHNAKFVRAVAAPTRVGTATESSIIGSHLRLRNMMDKPKGLIAFGYKDPARPHDEVQPTGMGFRYAGAWSMAGSGYAVTAAHVLKDPAKGLLAPRFLSGAVMWNPLKADSPLVYLSDYIGLSSLYAYDDSVDNTGKDIAAFALPDRAWSVLGIEVVKMAHLDSKYTGPVKVFGYGLDGLSMAEGPQASVAAEGEALRQSALASHLGLLEHYATTLDGFSGSPLYFYDSSGALRIRGLHVGTCKRDSGRDSNLAIHGGQVKQALETLKIRESPMDVTALRKLFSLRPESAQPREGDLPFNEGLQRSELDYFMSAYIVQDQAGNETFDRTRAVDAAKRMGYDSRSVFQVGGDIADEVYGTNLRRRALDQTESVPIPSTPVLTPPGPSAPVLAPVPEEDLAERAQLAEIDKKITEMKAYIASLTSAKSAIITDGATRRRARKKSQPAAEKPPVDLPDAVAVVATNSKPIRLNMATFTHTSTEADIPNVAAAIQPDGAAVRVDEGAGFKPGRVVFRKEEVERIASAVRYDDWTYGRPYATSHAESNAHPVEELPTRFGGLLQEDIEEVLERFIASGDINVLSEARSDPTAFRESKYCSLLRTHMQQTQAGLQDISSPDHVYDKNGLVFARAMARQHKIASAKAPAGLDPAVLEAARVTTGVDASKWTIPPNDAAHCRASFEAQAKRARADATWHRPEDYDSSYRSFLGKYSTTAHSVLFSDWRTLGSRILREADGSKSSGWTGNAGTFAGPKASCLADDRVSMFVAVAMQRLFLRACCGTEFLRVCPPWLAFKAGLADPKVLSVKQEPHDESKTREQRWRLIWILSFTDSYLANLSHREANKADLAAYACGALTSQCLGLGHHDDGITKLNEIFRDSAQTSGSSYMASQDAKGWDWSRCADDFAMTSQVRLDRFLCAENDRLLSVEDERYEAELALSRRRARTLELMLAGEFMVMTSHVVVVGDKLFALDFAGIMPSGHPSTAADNTIDRLFTLEASVTGDSTFMAHAAGDDVVTNRMLWPHELARLTDNFNVVVKGEQDCAWGCVDFTSHRFYYSDGGHARFLNFPKLVARLVSRVKQIDGKYAFHPGSLEGACFAVRHNEGQLDALRSFAATMDLGLPDFECWQPDEECSA